MAEISQPKLQFQVIRDDEENPFVTKEQLNVKQGLVHQVQQTILNPNFSIQNSLSNYSGDFILSLAVSDQEDPLAPPPENASYLHSNAKTQQLSFLNNQEMENSVSINIQIAGKSEEKKAFGSVQSPNQNTTNEENTTDQYPLEYFTGKQDKNLRMNNFVWLEVLGKGAFGTVTRIFDKSNRKFYAIKTISKSGLANPEKFKHIVMNEVENLNKLYNLDHDELLKIYGFQINQNVDTFQAIMEVGRATLDQISTFRATSNIEKWKSEELFQIIRCLIHQIDVLRQTGIYHRDIKPSNIILGYDTGAIKLTDYGCSEITKNTSETQSKIIKVAGTPYFMAPEMLNMLKNPKKNITKQIDIYATELYSIGVTILKTVEPQLRHDKILHYLENYFKVDYPQEIYEALSGLLSTDPSKRIETSKNLMSQISQDQQENFNFNITPQELEEFRRFQFKLIFEQDNSKSIQPSEYLKMSILEDATWIYKTLIDRAEDKSIHKFQLQVELYRCLVRQRKFEEAMTSIRALLFSSDLDSEEKEVLMLKGRLYYLKGVIYYELGKINDSIRCLDSSLDFKVKKLNLMDHEVNACLQIKGTCHRLNGDYALSNACWKQSLKITISSIELENFMDRELCYSLMVLRIEDKETLRQYLETLQKNQSQKEKLYGNTHPIIAKSLAYMGYICLSLGNIQKGEELLKRGIDLAQQQYGENNPEIATFYFEYGVYMNCNGKPHKAFEALTKAIEIEKNYTTKKEPLPSTQFNYLVSLHFKGQLAIPVEMYPKLNQSISKASTPMNLKLIFINLKLMYCLYFRREFAKAIELCQQSIKILEATSHSNSHLTSFYGVLMMAQADSGQLEQAEQSNKLMWDTWEANKAMYAQNPVMITTADGVYLLRKQKHNEAITKFKEALNLRNEQIKAGCIEWLIHINHCFQEIMIGQTFQELGDYGQALEQYNLAIKFCVDNELTEHFMLGKAKIRATYMKYQLSGGSEELKKQLQEGLKILEHSFEQDHPVIKLGNHLMGLLELK